MRSADWGGLECALYLTILTISSSARVLRGRRRFAKVGHFPGAAVARLRRRQGGLPLPRTTPMPSTSARCRADTTSSSSISTCANMPRSAPGAKAQARATIGTAQTSEMLVPRECAAQDGLLHRLGQARRKTFGTGAGITIHRSATRFLRLSLQHPFPRRGKTPRPGFWTA